MKSRYSLPVLALAAALPLTSGGVCAQAIDYRAFEQLFGEPVTASVTGSPQRASDVPATIDIVTAEDIRRSGARDLPGVLRHVAGVDVLQWGNDSADVSIRGYNQGGASRVLVLIDGRQLYADFFGLIPWAALPVELADIRQIEIVKGPNSALFGFNALRGVINIVTVQPYYGDVGEVSLIGGTQSLRQASALWGQRLGERGALRVSIGGNRNDDFSTPQAPEDVGKRHGSERLQMNVQGFWKLTDDVELMLQASHAGSRQLDFLPFQALEAQRTASDALETVLQANTRFGILHAHLYSNWLDAIHGRKESSRTPPINFRNQVTVAQLQDILKIGAAHTIRLEAEFRHNRVNTIGVEGPHIFFDGYAASGMWDWRLNDAISWTNAVRYDRLALGRDGFIPTGFGFSNADWNSRRISELSFNSNLIWRVSGRDTLRLGVARGTQLPSLVILGANLLQVGPNVWTSGIPTIEPTISLHYELAWERRLEAIDGHLRIAAFRDETSDLATPFAGRGRSPVLVSTSENIGDSDATGLEISLKGGAGKPWRWSLSYTPLHINDQLTPSFGLAGSLTDFEDTTPRDVVDASLGWSSGAWEIDAFLRYESAFDGVLASAPPIIVGRLVPVPAYVSVDARVAWRFSPRLTLALSGQNLLESTQKQTVVADVERRVLGTLTVAF